MRKSRFTESQIVAILLHLRRPARKRLPERVRAPLYVPRLPDTVSSADFMSDTLACGRRFRTFNVVDDFNREVLHIEFGGARSTTRNDHMMHWAT